MNTIETLLRASRVVAASAAFTFLFSSHAKAQVATPEMTYDGEIAKGTPGISKTTETEPGGYVERTWWDDGSGAKKLIEVRRFNKKKPPECLVHWITYTGKKGETITDDYGWSAAGGQTATRTVVDGTGTTVTEWDPTPPSGHWKFKSFTPPPTPTPTPTSAPSPTPTSREEK
jgi:hypothetical protein